MVPGGEIGRAEFDGIARRQLFAIEIDPVAELVSIQRQLDDAEIRALGKLCEDLVFPGFFNGKRKFHVFIARSAIRRPDEEWVSGPDSRLICPGRLNCWRVLEIGSRHGVQRHPFDEARFVIFRNERLPITDALPDGNGRVGIGAAGGEIPVRLRRVKRMVAIRRVGRFVG